MFLRRSWQTWPVVKTFFMAGTPYQIVDCMSPAGGRGQLGGNYVHLAKHRASGRTASVQGELPGDSAWAWFQGDSPGSTLRAGGRKLLSGEADVFPIPRLLVVSDACASRMRKSPQSKKPLHLDSSAPPYRLTEAVRVERFEANLTALRLVRIVPCVQRQAGGCVHLEDAGLLVRYHCSAAGKRGAKPPSELRSRLIDGCRLAGSTCRGPGERGAGLA